MFDPTNPIPTWSVSTMQRVAQEPTLAAAALRYANLGIPVFPCAPGGKQPLTPNGFHDATSVARVVHGWWQRTPDANIGLPTGGSTGVLVVDVDVHSSANGFPAFERARSEGFGDAWAWLVRTPSGGLHAYYPNVRGQEQRSWQVPAAHVDFRGDGGYVIAPPSRIAVDGATRSYEVIAVATHAPKLLDAVELRRFLEPPRPAPQRPPAGMSATGCRPEALARTVALTPEGGRNHALFWASCRMAENGLSQADAMSWLMPAAQYAGLPDREIETTVNSAFRIASRLGPGSRPGPTPASEGIHL
ncbi:bifunctional DNA primase/polymerase [Nocardioides sp. CN2-186]|uniref:bifunctional DNA primase/polymerase n=1 Tax=Nocardioides tweenelious TaxID=3156607 RepID=UPI0032B4C5DE